MFALIPREPRQATRVRRLFMAVGSYGLAVVTLVYAYLYSMSEPRLSLTGLIGWLIVLVAVNLGFYAVIRSGLNRRFADPSLTLPQLMVAVVLVTYVLYHAGEARGTMSMLYLVTFTFGLFQLSTRQFLAITAFTLACHGAMVTLLLLNPHAGVEPRPLVVNLIALAMVLPWFALVGGYISRLRDRLRGTNMQLEQALEKIGELAIRDELTGTFNRRHLLELLQQQKELADRSTRPFSVCVLDLDHFKAVNDRYGHLAGDRVLAAVARSVQRGLRNVDAMARFGGEEFVLVLTDTDLAGAERVAQRVHQRVAEARFEDLDPDLAMTVSIGVTTYARPEDITGTLSRADRALYRAKTEGRNLTVVIPPGGQDPEARAGGDGAPG